MRIRKRLTTNTRRCYAEFQPWVPIFRQNVRSYSDFLWGAAGPWKTAVAVLSQRNLITNR